MTQLFSLEFLVAFLFILDGCIIVLLVIFVKRVHSFGLSQTPGGGLPPEAKEDQAVVAAGEIIAMLEPLVKESREAAVLFDEQIREKRKLSKTLNDALDSRIISINLLLSRSEALLKKLARQKKALDRQTLPSVAPDRVPAREPNVVDQQNQIIELYFQNRDVDTIAQTLSIPRGEVQLVIDLKEKFMAMEKGE
jgi:hypothetical protein